MTFPDKGLFTSNDCRLTAEDGLFGMLAHQVRSGGELSIGAKPHPCCRVDLKGGVSVGWHGDSSPFQSRDETKESSFGIGGRLTRRPNRGAIVIDNLPRARMLEHIALQHGGKRRIGNVNLQETTKV
jgi:hypothetical protein